MEDQMSGATTDKSTVSTAITERDIRSRLREMMKLAGRLKNAGVGLSTEPYRLILQKGEFFAGAAAVKTDPVVHAHVRRHRPKPKECFYNGQLFVVFDSTNHATYYEGFVTSVIGGLVHHGWLVVNGVVIDPTIEAAVRKAKKLGVVCHPPAARQYFGMPFTRLDVAKQMAGGVCDPMLDGVFHTL
jgi:hypothetical protein